MANRFLDTAPHQQPAPQVDQYHARAGQFLDEHPNYTGGVANNFLHGVTGGVGNRLVAGLHAIAGQALSNDGLSFPERMKYETALEEEKHRRATADHPVNGMAAEILGGAVNPLARAVGAGVGALTASRFANAVGTGTALGATEGLMDTGSAEGAAQGGLYGAMGGALGHGIGKAVEGVANRFAPRYNAPSMDTLATQAADAESRFVNSGVTYAQPALDHLQQGIEGTLEAGRFSPAQHPNLAGSNVMPAIDDVVNRTPRPYQQVQPPVPYQKTHPIPRGPEDIRDISRVVQEAQGGSMKPSENRLLGQVQETVRNFPEAVDPAHVLSGDSQAAGAAWREANDLYTRQFKVNTLRDAFAEAADKARVSGSGGNIDNATRRAAMKVRDSRHDWTPDELEGLNTIMQGDDSWLRTLGRAAPQGNGLMQLQHMIGLASGDPKQALITLASQAARYSTDNSTQNAVTRLDQMIRGGGNASVFPQQTAAQRIAPQFTRNLPGPFAQLFASQVAPAPVKGGRR